ncbi:hypothetical protein PoB_005554400 [Plakobranchus ocellatus]|uniref:Uncharacterized protein n=1 Tax=Plakobranchus ocellatus TaxID=259542 RepID=A0AAV4CE79_9GAST|nr:hypothetical protein PoB_005554400 [Plakobranchus ocellatus]
MCQTVTRSNLVRPWFCLRKSISSPPVIHSLWRRAFVPETMDMSLLINNSGATEHSLLQQIVEPGSNGRSFAATRFDLSDQQSSVDVTFLSLDLTYSLRRKNKLQVESLPCFMNIKRYVET